jgi:hypothetical protein
MTTTTNLKPSRLCCVCDKQLYGRSDKVFCDIHCKNKYHANVRKHTQSASANNIKILAKNYQILCQLLGTDCERYVTKKLFLQKQGFNFEIISAMANTKYGLKMHVFELSWYYAANDNIVVLQDKKQSKISPYMYKRWQRHYEPLQTHPPEKRISA